MFIILIPLLLVFFNQDVLCVIFGNTTYQEKRYMAYFVRSPYADKVEDLWVCGGSIISPTQILTAAGCLMEMKKVYAIVGYKTLVRESELDENRCTKEKKEKVIKIIIPKGYKLTRRPEDWMLMDIAVAIVEKPYDFNDYSYRVLCSYPPEPIKVLLTKNYDLNNIHGTVYGWGHYFGVPIWQIDWESGFHLQGAATTLHINVRECNDVINSYHNYQSIMKFRLLCGFGKGALDTDGRFRSETRRQFSNNNTFNMNNNSEATESGRRQYDEPMDPGACTGDHGGPLVTWIGEHEVQIGVTMNSFGRDHFMCQWPFFYTSTVAVADVLKCLMETDEASRSKCNEKITREDDKAMEVKVTWPEENLRIKKLDLTEEDKTNEALDDETIITKYRERIQALNDSVLLAYLKKKPDK